MWRLAASKAQQSREIGMSGSPFKTLLQSHDVNTKRSSSANFIRMWSHGTSVFTKMARAMRFTVYSLACHRCEWFFLSNKDIILDLIRNSIFYLAGDRALTISMQPNAMHAFAVKFILKAFMQQIMYIVIHCSMARHSFKLVRCSKVIISFWLSHCTF